MKKTIFCILVFLASKNSNAEAISMNETNLVNSLKLNADTATYPISSFSAVNWAYYLNKPINTLLLYLDGSFLGYILSNVYSNDRLNIAGKIDICYGNARGLIIYVNRFQFMNPVTTDGTWDVNLFRQENVSAIELWDNTVCVYNSNP